jgi:Tol biopolymer transport system component
LYRVTADGSTDPAPFFSRRPVSVYESRLTPDGRRLVFREDGNVRDILVAPVDSPAAARPLAATAFNERSLALSPDGRWLAFASNLSGSAEVYVRRLEDGSPRWKASLGGGVAPRWGLGGRELFYRNGDTLYVVSAQLGAEARFGEPRALFDAAAYLNSGNEALYDVSPDGRRFVMIRQMGAERVTVMHVVLHRFDQRGRSGADER